MGVLCCIREALNKTTRRSSYGSGEQFYNFFPLPSVDQLLTSSDCNGHLYCPWGQALDGSSWMVAVRWSKAPRKEEASVNTEFAIRNGHLPYPWGRSWRKERVGN